MTLASNSLEGRAEGYLARIERILDELETKRGEYMAECKSLREDLKEIKTEAKDNGITVKALNAIVKERQLQKKIAALADDLDIDEAAQYRQLADALGGPLGEYAGRRAAGADEDDRDLRGHQQRQTEKERADERPDADALKKIGRGPQPPAAH